MHPQAIINEMFARQKELLQEAEAMRPRRQLAATEPGFWQAVSQSVANAGQAVKAQFRSRLSTPIFGRH